MRITIFFILGCLTLILAFFCFRNASIPFIAFGLFLPFLLSFWMVYLNTNRAFKEVEDIEDESREIDWELSDDYAPSWLEIMLTLYACSAIPLFSFLFSLYKEAWLFSLVILYLLSPILGMCFAIAISLKKLSKN